MPGKLFTIALPVRNGGAFLRPCVESILGQSCGDFDLAILDNASTDGTTDYLASLRDSRVRLYPADRPLSITENWARIKGIQKNEFLTTIGHDDLLDSDFLSVIGSLISAHPKACLYLTHFRLIDERGQVSRPCRPMPGLETAAEFLAARLTDLRDSFGTGYVLRAAAYDAVGGIPPFPRLLYADDMLWLRTMIGGGVRITSSQECFSYRYYAGSVARTSPMTDYLPALEIYWDELEKLARQDSEIDRVLTRYGPSYLVLFGRGCRRATLDGRILHGEAADPALDARLERLLGRAGLTLDDLHRRINDRSLALAEWAARTHSGRSIYRLFSLIGRAAQRSQRLAPWNPSNCEQGKACLARARAVGLHRR